MKWNKLADKEPPFDLGVILWSEGVDSWDVGVLTEIKQTSSGKEFVFTDHDSNTIDAIITHWGIPSKPKE